MTQTAKVIKTEGEYAIVSVSRKAMCDGCHNSGSACSQCLTFGDKNAECKTLNKAGAKVGDTVTVSTRSSLVLGYSVLVFLLPMLLAVAVYALSEHLKSTNSVLFAIIAFVLSFCISCLALDRKIKAKPDTEIIEIKTTEQL